MSQELFTQEVNRWAQELLKNAWVACQEPGGGTYLNRYCHRPLYLSTAYRFL